MNGANQYGNQVYTIRDCRCFIAVITRLITSKDYYFPMNK